MFPTHHGEANVWCAGPVASTPKLGTVDRGDAFHRGGPSLPRTRGADGRWPADLTGPRVRRHAEPVRRATGPGWALVGDASYFRDATTGHGISDAFRDAEDLALAADRALRVPATESEALAVYERTRARAIADLFDVTCRLALYPPMTEFVALQRRLTELVDVESARLAAMPPIPRVGAAAA